MSQPASRSSHLNGHHLTRFQNLKNPSTTPAAYCRDLTRLCLRSCLYWSQTEKLSWSRNCLSSKLGRPRRVRGVASFTPRSVDGRATARHLHGKIERAARCLTVKVQAESADAECSLEIIVPSTLTTRALCPTRTTVLVLMLINLQGAAVIFRVGRHHHRGPFCEGRGLTQTRPHRHRSH